MFIHQYNKMTKRREFIQKSFFGIGGIALAGIGITASSDAPFNAGNFSQLILDLRFIDTTRVGKAMPDSSAAVDIDGDGQIEILTLMQDANGHPEILLYKRNSEGHWDSTTIGVVQMHQGEIEYIAVGRPFPGDSRYCVAASVQHKEDGLVVFRLREPGISPFDITNWETGVAKEYAGQGLAFHDLNGDGIDELIYCTQAGNELGVLKIKEEGNPMEKSGWNDHLIDTGNNRSWWWLDGKFYDLNGNGFKNDFFVSTRAYGGKDLGMWKIVQTIPNDFSSYQVEKIHSGDSLFFDTGFFFSNDRERTPDIVMANLTNEVYLMDGRNGYTVTRLPLAGIGWNIKVLPFLSEPGSRDAFVVATTESESLFWSYRWRNGHYEVQQETGHVGNYSHPMDGTFTIADVDGDGEPECIVPDSSSDKRSKGLAYLKAIPVVKDHGPG
jgi:hypothetical protein